MSDVCHQTLEQFTKMLGNAIAIHTRPFTIREITIGVDHICFTTISDIEKYYFEFIPSLDKLKVSRV